MAAGLGLPKGSGQAPAEVLAPDAERILEMAQQTADLEALYQADEELDRWDRLDDLLQALVNIAVERLGADKSALFCLDERRERLVIRVANGFSPAFRDRFSAAPEEGVAGHVMQTGQPVLVEDTVYSPRNNTEPREMAEAALSEGVLSFMDLPIRLEDSVFGVLNISYIRPHTFSAREQRLFTSLARRASIAIENASHLERERRRVDQLNALQETTRALASTLDLDALLTLIIEQATVLLKADGGMVNLVDWKKGEDEVVAVAGIAVPVRGTHNALDAGLSGWVALHNQPVLSNDVIADSRTARVGRDWVVGSQIQCTAMAPLTVKDQIIGTLAIMGTREGKRSFVQDDLDLLVAFANQAAVAIDNARLYLQAQELAAVQERNRLARELHDAVTQTLFSASLIAEVLPATWAADPAEGQELLGQLRQLNRGALAEMRTLLLELRPAALAEAKLADLLKQLAEAVGGRTGLPVAVEVDQGCELPVEVSIALYRVAQEALNNVIKHAQARSVRLELTCLAAATALPSEMVPDPQDPHPQDQCSGGGARLCIADDGQGFDVDAASRGHLGLRSIRERAQSIGAEAEICSSPGCGTRVTVTWTAGEALSLETGSSVGSARLTNEDQDQSVLQ